MSLYLGDRLVCKSRRTCIIDGHLNKVTYTRRYFDQINSPDDEYDVARNM
jgi:hypothetical protein